MAAAERRHTHIADPLERTVALTALIRVLQEQLQLVAGERDQAMIGVLAAHTHPSHRRLSTDLFLSHQRVDQMARRGGRPAATDRLRPKSTPGPSCRVPKALEFSVEAVIEAERSQQPLTVA